MPILVHVYMYLWTKDNLDKTHIILGCRNILELYRIEIQIYIQILFEGITCKNCKYAYFSLFKSAPSY